MSRHIKLHDNVNEYAALVRMLIDQGRPMKSRVGDTLELEDVTLDLLQPRYACPVNRPHYSHALGRLEGAQLVAGVVKEDVMKLVVPKITDYSDFYGSYGPRADKQLPLVVKLLQDDRDTRRAVISLWDAKLDAKGGHKDHPCTLAITFRVRNDLLNMSVHMRSNDVWRGWAYDAVQFSVLQHTVANVLDLDVGTYVHHADSFHIYTSDVETAESWLSHPIEYHEHPNDIYGAQVSGFGWRGCTLDQARLEALRAMAFNDEFTYGEWEFGLVSKDAQKLHTALWKKAKVGDDGASN